MNSQERESLDRFLGQLSRAQVGSKIPEAEELIRSAFAAQPDAGYLLVQRSMLLEQALESAKAQIAQLQSQLQAAQSSAGNKSSFLGSNPWGQAADSPSSGGVPGASNYQMPRAGAPMAPPTQAFGGGGSSFLGNIATTAAGVVAGSFLFQGIENLLGHHQSSPWGSNSDPGIDRLTENTVINNYYGSDGESRDDLTSSVDDDNILASDDTGFGDDFQDSGDDDSSWV